MVHGYIHNKKYGNSLFKLDIPSTDTMTGFNYNEENDIICTYNKTLNKFELYSGLEETTLLKVISPITDVYGYLKNILSRLSYIQETVEYKRIVFVYFAITSRKQIIKINVIHYLSEDKSEMRITNLTNKTYEYDDGDELEIAVLRNTDDYDLVTHDPAFILFNVTKNTLYCSNLEGDLLNYKYTIDTSDINLVNSKFTLITPSEYLCKDYSLHYPIISVYPDDTFNILFINFERNMISRKITIDNNFATDLIKKTFDLNGNILTISGLNCESNKIESFSIDLNNTNSKKKEKDKVSDKHDLSLSLFFNGGEYIRQNGDKIKIAIRSYNPSLQYPNKQSTIVRSVDEFINVKKGISNIYPNIFEDYSKVREFVEKDITDTEIKISNSKNTIAKKIIGNKRLISLLSQLNRLDEENNENFNYIYKDGEVKVKVIRLEDNEIKKDLYSAIYNENDGFEIKDETSSDDFGAVVLTDGKYFGETNSDFMIVSLVDGIHGEKLIEPIMVRKQEIMKTGSGKDREISLSLYNQTVSIKENDEDEFVDDRLEKNIVRKYGK